MSKIELLTMLTDACVRYKKDWRDSVKRNCHMHKAELTAIDQISENTFDAILIGFINQIGVEQGLDYALYSKDLKTHKPKWE